MKQLDNYISEKLVINKNIKVFNNYFVPNSIEELDEYVKTQKLKTNKSNGVYGTKENPVNLSRIDFSKLALRDNEILSYWCLDDNDIAYVDMSYCKFGNMLSIDHMFEDFISIKFIDITGWDLGKIEILTGLFSGCIELKEIQGIDSLDLSNVSRITGLFRNCKKLEKVDVSKWNTKNIVRMASLFKDCTSLTDIGDVSNFSLDNIESLANMFNNCINLSKIKGIENWKLPKCMNLKGIFYNCTNLNINIDNWEIPNDVKLEDSFTNTNIKPKWYKP